MQRTESGAVLVIFDPEFMAHVLGLVSAADAYAEADAMVSAVLAEMREESADPSAYPDGWYATLDRWYEYAFAAMGYARIALANAALAQRAGAL